MGRFQAVTAREPKGLYCAETEDAAILSHLDGFGGELTRNSLTGSRATLSRFNPDENPRNRFTGRGQSREFLFFAAPRLGALALTLRVSK